MSDQPVSKSCPQCGAAVPDDVLGGLCPKCLMVQAAASTGGDGLPPESKSPPSLEAVRDAFPQLEILGLIGQGGMAAVFKARQPKLNRLVALKILPAGLAADPAFAERFAREGQMLARLNHPNIVAVHDFGESGSFYYLLMEYVDGVNLRQALRSGGFTPQQALGIVPKICEALQYAHDEGVLHRDIKPENILLDAKGRVKIADFGIAKFAKEATAAERLTGAGASLGTPHYMAPEQFERPSEVDHRADIYSLGVVFYELLTGELPLGRFAPPSEKAAVDARVDDVVLKALERERERRQQTACEVKTQVETILQTPTSAKRIQHGEPQWVTDLLGATWLCSPAALFIWFLLVGQDLWGIDIATDEQMWIGLIGFPACAGAGILLTWILKSFGHGHSELENAGLRSWSRLAAVAALLLLASVLVTGFELGAMKLGWHAVGHRNPASSAIAVVMTTLVGWLARRELQQAPHPLRGWHAACAAAWFWPGIAVGVLFLAALTWRYAYFWARIAFVMIAAVGFGAVVLTSMTLSRKPAALSARPRRVPQLLGAMWLCSPAALFVWFLFVGHGLCGIDLDSEEQMWIGLIGFPACAGAGILLAWLSGSFRRRHEAMQTSAPQGWSARAIAAAILLAVSTLLMGGGSVVAVLLRHEVGDWHPAPAELVFAVAFLGGGVLASVLATLAGWSACREIQRASPPMRGWQAACVAAWFWPGVAVGVFLLVVAASSYEHLWARIAMGMVGAIGLTAVGLRWVYRRLPTGKETGTHNPWPRRVFWLILAVFVLPPLLLAVVLLVPYFAARAPSSEPSVPRARAVFDNVTAVEDLVTFDLFVILDPPHPELRMCYLGRPLEASGLASVPKPASGVVLGPATELQERQGQHTWRLSVRETGPAVLSSHVVLVLPDANMARKAAEQIRWPASQKREQPFSRGAKLKLFALDATPQGPYAAWLEFPSGPNGTAVVVNWQPDADAVQAKQPKVVGNVVVPYGYLAEFEVLLRKGDSEQRLPELGFFAVHDDPQRRQELLSVPVAWSLSPNERARSFAVVRLQAGDGSDGSIDILCAVPGTKLVAWRMSPGYLTDEVLIAGLRGLPLDRLLVPIGPLGPGELHTSRLFYGEPKLPREPPADESSLSIMLWVSVHRLPDDWANPRPGIHVQSGARWREHLGLAPEPQDSPAIAADAEGKSGGQESAATESTDAVPSRDGPPAEADVPTQPLSRTLTLRLEQGGKLLVNGQPYVGDGLEIMEGIRDDAELQVNIETGEGVADDDLNRIRQLVDAARRQRDPRNRELWEQIAQRQDLELRKEALDKLQKMLTSEQNPDRERAVRALQKVEDVPFDRAPLLPLVRQLIADSRQSSYTRAIAAVQLASLGGGKEDIPMIAAMADDPDQFIRKGVAAALYNLDPKGEHPLIVPAIEKLLFDESAGVQGVVHHTVKALSGMPVSPAAERRLIELSKQPGPSGGIGYDTVYYALSTRPVVSKPVAERLVELALPPDTKGHVSRAVWGLSHHAASDDARELAVETLIRIFDDSLDSGLRQDCVFGLGLHGGDTAVEKLQEIAAQEEDTPLRKQAQSALERAQPKAAEL